MSRRWVLTFLLILASPILGQPKGGKPLPDDLALVPADSDIILHVKLADLWKSEALAQARTIYAKAGAEAIAAFDKRFVPLLSTVDRLTVYVHRVGLNASPEDVKFIGILRLTEDLDQKRFVLQFTDKPVAKKGKFADYVTDDDGEMAFRFVSPRLVAFGSPEAIQAMCDLKEVPATGPQRAMLDRAAGPGEPFSLGFCLDHLPAEARDQMVKEIPPPLRPLFRASTYSLSMDLEGDGHVHARVSYADEKAAEDAEMAVVAGTGMAIEVIRDTRKQLLERVIGDGKPGKIEALPEAATSLLGLGALQHVEDILRSKPVKRSGAMLSLSQPLPPQLKTFVGAGAMGSSMILPATQRIRAAASRMKSSNNLKQIGLALHNYHDVNGVFPPVALTDKKGKPLLSWRVAILPYIEQDNLYKQFKFDEPWDSEHNLKLSQTNIPVFTVPANKKHKPGHTNYRVFHGNGALFDFAKGVSIAAIVDGTSNTWMVVEADESVPWAKPDDFEFDPKKELPKLGGFYRGGFHALLGDGSVRFYGKTPKFANELITRGGGEVIPDE